MSEYTISIFVIIYSKEMSSGPLNSTAFSEDYLLQNAETDLSVEAIEVDEDLAESIDLSVTEQEITEISNIAAQLELENIVILPNQKRIRETSEQSVDISYAGSPAKKVRKVMMAPP